MSYTAIGLYNTGVVNKPLFLGRVGRQTLTAAQAATLDADGLLAAEALPAAAADYTTFENDMPYARNVTAVCSDTQTGNMVITGTNIDDVVITETVALNSGTPVTSTKAFKTVTNINLPIKVGTETINVGWGDKIGIPFMLGDAADRPMVEATLDGVIETTAPALTADADELEKNLIDLHSDLNGKEVCIYYYL